MKKLIDLLYPSELAHMNERGLYPSHLLHCSYVELTVADIVGLSVSLEYATPSEFFEVLYSRYTKGL